MTNSQNMYKYKILGWNVGGWLRKDFILIEVEAKDERAAISKAKKLVTRKHYQVETVWGV